MIESTEGIWIEWTFKLSLELMHPVGGHFKRSGKVQRKVRPIGEIFCPHRFCSETGRSDQSLKLLKVGKNTQSVKLLRELNDFIRRAKSRVPLDKSVPVSRGNLKSLEAESCSSRFRPTASNVVLAIVPFPDVRHQTVNRAFSVLFTASLEVSQQPKVGWMIKSLPTVPLKKEQRACIAVVGMSKKLKHSNRSGQKLKETLRIVLNYRQAKTYRLCPALETMRSQK